MAETLDTDIVIIGGGIAGLWLNYRLRSAGYSTVLLERQTLGGGQTVRSQGIIHGGTKYALHGALSNASNAISEMPARWRACLNGEGDVDLSSAKVLSEYHYMWSRDRLMSKLTSFFASKAVRGKVETDEFEQRPEAFKNPAFHGNFYALNEIVVDVPSVINALISPFDEGIYQYDCAQHSSLELDNGSVTDLQLFGKNKRVRIKAKRYILTAGEGNESVLHSAQLHGPAMQRRPLHMVVVKHHYPHPIYAHCIGSGSKPLLTITTHYMADGQPVWYLGGNLAETGVELDKQTQLESAKTLIKELLPWVDLGEAHWDSFMIHRAEPQQNAMLRPDSAFVHQNDNVITCWPTKLALTPNLVDEVLEKLEQDNITPELATNYELLKFLSRPPISKPVWQELLS
ncbi:FAD-dependent oxidoreductase [Hahella sp. CCB-MM4]|uniref:FAD-dependent oxidoreductase n=1 Tax=Hahella sp. (strain CCB-MM4) TaxID=1926491 RepID=UPI000B9C1568|nr:FAD-dependent oxidoreductase [Hahella sp. CCB-MM4]OZG71412.1 FAD-dependent oxidoreductase [Hahella sp. CCB-MM4]